MGEAARSAGAAPDCSVTISPLLRAIRAGAWNDPAVAWPGACPVIESPVGAEPPHAPPSQHAQAPRAWGGSAQASTEQGRALPAVPGSREADRPSVAVRGAASARYRLRRDGARPLVFDGALLLHLAARTPGSDSADGSAAPECGSGKRQAQPGAALQTLDLFVTDAGAVVAAIRVEAEGAAPFRPIFRARTIDAADEFATFLADHDPGAAAGIGRAQAGAMRADFARMIDEAGLAPGRLPVRALRPAGRQAEGETGVVPHKTARVGHRLEGARMTRPG